MMGSDPDLFSSGGKTGKSVGGSRKDSNLLGGKGTGGKKMFPISKPYNSVVI